MASPKRGSRARTAPVPVVDTTGWYGVPQQPQRYVRRPRLLALLDDANSYDLVLVSAPAGSGKSSLVADWVATKDQPDRIAWVTFEPEDEAIWPGLAGCLEQLGVHVPRSGAAGHRRACRPSAPLAGRHGRRRSSHAVDDRRGRLRGGLTRRRGGPRLPPQAQRPSAPARARDPRRPGAADVPLPPRQLGRGRAHERPEVHRRRGRTAADEVRGHAEPVLRPRTERPHRRVGRRSPLRGVVPRAPRRTPTVRSPRLRETAETSGSTCSARCWTPSRRRCAHFC